MKYKFTIILFFNIFFLATNNAETLINGSIESGKTKSTTCAACHGADGNSINPIWPSIAGQHATYAEKQLKAYKNGVRIDPLMTSMTTMLSDQDIADLAVYYENLTAKQNSINDDSSIIKLIVVFPHVLHAMALKEKVIQLLCIHRLIVSSLCIPLNN